MTKVPVYQWADGSQVEIQMNPSGPTFYFDTRKWSASFYNENQEMFWAYLEINPQNQDELRKKLSGFLVDLGVQRPSTEAFSPDLIRTTFSHEIKHLGVYPRFISDGAWENRYNVPVPKAESSQTRTDRDSAG